MCEVAVAEGEHGTGPPSSMDPGLGRPASKGGRQADLADGDRSYDRRARPSWVWSRRPWIREGRVDHEPSAPVADVERGLEDFHPRSSALAQVAAPREPLSFTASCRQRDGPEHHSSASTFTGRTCPDQHRTIVGAGPRLGLAIARAFGSQGFDVALISRNPERLDSLVGTPTFYGQPRATAEQTSRVHGELHTAHRDQAERIFRG